LSESRQNTILLVFLLVAQLVLMSGSARSATGATVLESWLMWVSSPGVVVARAFTGTIKRGVDEVRDLLAARSRNKVLEAEVRHLSSELVRHREAEPENRRLRRLLGMRDVLVPESVAAVVVTSNLNGSTRMIVVDRGRLDGVRRDLPVIAWGGVVGRVMVAESRHSKVRLLTDASSGVAGVVQRSRVQGIVFGRASSALEMLYVPRFSDVLHGDRVVTSGIDGVFPRGFGIGRVGSITTRPDGTQTLHLVPDLDFRALEEVLILLEPGAGESPPLDGSGDTP